MSVISNQEQAEKSGTSGRNTLHKTIGRLKIWVPIVIGVLALLLVTGNLISGVSSSSVGAVKPDKNSIGLVFRTPAANFADRGYTDWRDGQWYATPNYWLDPTVPKKTIIASRVPRRGSYSSPATGCEADGHLHVARVLTETGVQASGPIVHIDELDGYPFEGIICTATGTGNPLVLGTADARRRLQEYWASRRP